ncbi:hypothetical protein [Massilia sp. CF038]|uniref:hypothetical protein n=1 Tax=Massilia sp. CF038 TaxID=1881045 RepID=UPI00091764AF|nr:hypothetical protein [Massilia sp. CF038]SHH21018.1 hypothetical protein SAMN05428948_3327 [Massilia sp. CF038]
MSLTMTIPAAPIEPDSSVYEDWISHCFDHPVDDNGWNDWAWSDAALAWQLPASTTLACLRRLFNTSSDSLRRFSDEQLRNGFDYLLMSSADIYTLKDPSLPEADRLTCVRALSNLFSGIFSERCTDAPCRNSKEEEHSVLNSVCYMWFDIMPIHATFGAESKRYEVVMFDVLEAVLALDSLACQEAALHGLGHWADPDNFDRIEQIVAAYLDRISADHVLRAYARPAAFGSLG